MAASVSPITRIRIADRGKGMGMITSIATMNKAYHTMMHRQRTEKLGYDLRCGMADRILDGSLQVDEYLTTLLNASHGGSEIVIE